MPWARAAVAPAAAVRLAARPELSRSASNEVHIWAPTSLFSCNAVTFVRAGAGGASWPISIISAGRHMPTSCDLFCERL